MAIDNAVFARHPSVAARGSVKRVKLEVRVMVPLSHRPVRETFLKWLTAFLVFGILFVAILRLTPASMSPLDLLLGRTGGEALRVRLGDELLHYPLQSSGTGHTTDVAAIDGRLLFMNFWATWCPPCLTELPSLLDLASARASEGLVIVAVSYDESWDTIDTFMRGLGPGRIPPNFRIFRDPSPHPDRDLKSRFGTSKLPESYLVRDGTIVAKYINARDWTDPDILATLDLLMR